MTIIPVVGKQGDDDLMLALETLGILYVKNTKYKTKGWW
jgi:hypothetical protein